MCATICPHAVYIPLSLVGLWDASSTGVMIYRETTHAPCLHLSMFMCVNLTKVALKGPDRSTERLAAHPSKPVLCYSFLTPFRPYYRTKWINRTGMPVHLWCLFREECVMHMCETKEEREKIWGSLCLLRLVSLIHVATENILSSSHGRNAENEPFTHSVSKHLAHLNIRCVSVVELQSVAACLWFRVSNRLCQWCI